MKRNIRILHVDDNVHDRKLVRDVLEKEQCGFELIEADSREKFVKYLKEEKFDLVLSDFNILGFDGLQVIEIVKETDPSLPVIIITGTGSEEVAIQAMKLGAADYVIKSVKHIQGLPPTINTVLEHKRNKEQQKKIEEALRLTENKYQKILESMMDGFAFVDMSGIITNCNKAFQQMLGYTLSELKALKYTDITPTRWHNIEDEIINKQVLLKGYSDIYEKEYIRKDGIIFPVEIRTFLYRNDNGENEGLWAIIRDITIRKHNEDVLIQSEANFRELFEYSPVGKSITSLDGSLEVNNSFCEMLGYTKEELHLKKWQDITIHEDIPKSDAIAQSLLKGEISVARFEKRFLHKKGKIVWTDISVYLRRDKENNPKFFITTVSDITERKNAERKLRESEWKHRIVADNTYDWEFWCDQERRFVYCSPSCYRMTGHKVEEFMTNPSLMEQIIHPGDHTSFREHLIREAFEENPIELNFRIVHTDGSVKWIGHICQPIIDENGNKIGRRGSNRDITVQMQSEEVIKKSEARFRSYFELSIAGIAITSSEMKWIEVNEYLCDMMGYTREELLSITWTELTHPEDIDIDLENFQRVIKNEIEGYTIDKRFIHKDGRIIWTSLSVKCVRNISRQVDYFMALLVDISARKQAEESLQKTTSELQLIIKNMLNAFIMWESVFDENGKYVSFRFGFFNDAYANIAKIKQEEVSGKDVFEVWPDTESSWVEVYGNVAITGMPQTFDMYHEPTKGWYHCNAYRPSDSTKMICVIFEDITTRKKMEEKLAWEQYLMYTLLDNIPDYIYFKDLESRFVRINKALANVFGLEDPLMAIGKRDSDFFMTEHSQEAFNDEQNIIKTGIPIIGKEEMEIWPDRPSDWVSTTKMPLKNAKGEVIGTFGISRNISEMIRIQDDLLKAKEKAEESNRLKTAFLQNISHEIRTPLNAIIGFSSLLAKNGLAIDKKVEFIDIINKSSDQLLSIITGIISLATLEAGQETIIETETNVNEILRNVYMQFLVTRISNEITFSYSTTLPDEIAIIYTDQVKLMQVLVNLVGNALKFTIKGKVRFGYTVEEGMFRFFVEDTGIGIDKKMHDVIFERFRQVDNSATRKFGGAGLGLALSKGYIEMLGGTIKLTSEPGIGSTFMVSLPYINVSRLETVQKSETSEQEITALSEKTVLVAEDEINNFSLINELLTSMHLHVIHAKNGLEAVKLCSGEILPDLVLMDIMMPIMDGIEATRQIKERNPDLPVIVLTAYVLNIDKKRIDDSGCDDYIAKPIRNNLLLEILTKYLK
jgi:PAS domain S-box-containing protein